MRLTRYAAAIAAAVLLAAAPALGATDEFDTDRLIENLQEQLELSSDKLSELRPALDAKSRALKESIHQSVDQGFMQLDALTERLDTASKEAEEKLRSTLNSEEMQKLKEQLQKIDRDAIRETRDRLVAELAEFLALTEAQLAELKPALDSAFDELSTMLRSLASEGNRNLDQFRERFEQLTEELKQSLRNVLDGEQIELLETHRDELREKIQSELFQA